MNILILILEIYPNNHLCKDLKIFILGLLKFKNITKNMKLVKYMQYIFLNALPPNQLAWLDSSLYSLCETHWTFPIQTPMHFPSLVRWAFTNSRVGVCLGLFMNSVHAVVLMDAKRKTIVASMKTNLNALKNLAKSKLLKKERRKGGRKFLLLGNSKCWENQWSLEERLSRFYTLKNDWGP